MNFDPIAFDNAIKFHIKSDGVGTLNERCLHSVVKYFVDSDTSHHEKKLCGYVADVFDGDKITEVQTRGFGNLDKKLEAFLAEYPVNVVFPCAHRKNICWVDPDNGEIIKKSRSPKVGDGRELLFEASALRRHFGNPNLTFTVILIDLDEYKLVEPKTKSRRYGTLRIDRVPRGLFAVINIEKPRDFIKILPPGFPGGRFCTDEFAKALGRRRGRHTNFALNTLIAADAVKFVGYADNRKTKLYMLNDAE